jgi:hypothetical protein
MSFVIKKPKLNSNHKRKQRKESVTFSVLG